MTGPIRETAAAAPAGNVVRVRALGVLDREVGPVMRVFVNGAIVGETEVRNASYQDFDFGAGTLAASDRIDVQFVNGSSTRSLTVESVVVGDVTMRPADAGVVFDIGLEEAAFDGLKVLPGRELVKPAGALRFTLPSNPSPTIRVRALGALDGDVGPVMRVLVNGTVVGAREVRDAWFQHFDFRVDTLAPGDRIDIQFINGSSARSLTVESVAVGDVTMRPTDARVVFDIGPEEEAFDGLRVLPGRELLKPAGALRFTLPSNPPPTIADTLYTGQGRYLDAIGGNDLNPGTAESPWRTLARASQAVLAPGDALLLKCGGTWRESLVMDSRTAPSGGVTIGIYGGGCNGSTRPVISGADRVITTGWALDTTLGGRPIHVAPWTKPVSRLFWNGALMIKARYPNYGGIGNEFNLLARVDSATSVGLPPEDLVAIGEPDLSGTRIFIRTENWVLEETGVTSSDMSDGALTLSPPLRMVPDPGDGYFLEGKLAMLDSPGEWFHDEARGLLYFWAPGGVNPSAGLLESVERSGGITLDQVPSVRVEHVVLDRQSHASLTVSGARQARIFGVTSLQAGEFGIEVRDRDEVGSDDARIEQTEVADSNRVGIYLESYGATVTSSLVRNTSVGPTGHGYGHAIQVRRSGATIAGNRIYNAAYSGVAFGAASGLLITQNDIMGACRRWTDCGAIYSGEAPIDSVRTTISFNRVRDLSANSEGTVRGASQQVAGIYLDGPSRYHDVVGNMISNIGFDPVSRLPNGIGFGIQVHESSYNRVERNTVWLPSKSSLRATQWSTNKGDLLRGNVIADNLFFGGRYLLRPGAPETAPTTIEIMPQNWAHVVSADAPFVGVDPNIVAGNVAGTVNYAGMLIWKAYSPASNEIRLDLNQWNAFTGANERVLSAYPVRLALPVLDGPNAIENPQLQAPGAPWQILKSPDSPSTVAFGTCGASGCADIWLADRADALQSNAFSLSAAEGSNLYLLRYRSRGLEGDAIVDARIWNVGFAGVSQLVSGARQEWVETLFNAAGEQSTRLRLRGPVGVGVRIAEAGVYRVRSYETYNPFAESTLLANESSEPRSYSCLEAGLRSCDLVTLDGQSVSWPITLEPRSSLVVVTADSKWRFPD